MPKARQSAFLRQRPTPKNPPPGPRARHYKCRQVYHVYQRGNFGRPVFRSPAEMALYLNRFFLLARRHNVRVHNFCLMKTHVHFVLEQLRCHAIGKLMRDLQGLHTRKQNTQLETFGNLWNHHYRSKHVNSPAYYRTLMWYVSNNPVKARLCKRPEDYLWSGARALSANGPVAFRCNDSTVKIALYLGRFQRDCQPEAWPTSVKAPLPADLLEYETLIEEIKDLNMRLFEAQQHTNAQRIDQNNALKAAARKNKKLRRKLGPGAFRQHLSQHQAANAPSPAPPKPKAAPASRAAPS